MQGQHVALVHEIVTALELDLEYTRVLESADQRDIEEVRTCGRAAGRAIRHRIRTSVTAGPGRKQVTVKVWVTDPDPEDFRRVNDRWMRRMRAIIEGLKTGSCPPEGYL